MSDHYQLPPDGLSYETVTQEIDELFAAMTPESSGKLSSTAFWGVSDAYNLSKAVYSKFFSWNALFTFQEAAAAKIENDVLDICISLAGGNADSRGNLTSGGTESNFCALHAMRNWARQTRPDISAPEVVAPYSIHATVHKVAQVLDIKMVTVPQNADLSADLIGIKGAINANTIGIVASAPNWPYGTVDPIAALGKLALTHDLWLHVDACVGAYILPFFRDLGESVPAYDLSVAGVRSLSGDLHKYGYAPKPCSTILWRSVEEQAHHYLPITQWPCGLYLSQGLVGSRPLAPVAAIWALMHYLGRAGYVENARKLLQVRGQIIDKVSLIEGLQTWPTDGPLLQISSNEIDIQLVVGAMGQKGWRLLGVIDPPAIHLTIDVLSEEQLQKFLLDLEESVTDIRSGKSTPEGLLSYGGVGAEESAPKWLQSAVDIFERNGNMTEDH
ncbi:MAG: pyridoxal phosphate-dependent decarboxylase family protein [Pseudomonadales bacterium]